MARRYEVFEYSGGTRKGVRRIVKEPRRIPLKPFKARRATIEVDGSKVRADVLPYTYETRWMYRENTTEEYGHGIYLQECQRCLYMYGGIVYKHARWREYGGSEWHEAYVRYDGGAYGRCGTGLDPIVIRNGVIVA